MHKIDFCDKILNMKRFYIALFSILILLSAAYSEKFSGSSVIVFSPELQNISSDDASWLPGAVRDKIEADLRTAGNFHIVDNSNEEKIKALQKKSESLYFNEDTALEMGKLTSARYAIFSTVRKAGKTYNFSASFTDLISGQKEAFALSRSRGNVNAIYGGGNCAVSEVILKLLNQLDIPVSAEVKKALEEQTKEEKILETQEQKEIVKQEKQEQKTQMALNSNYAWAYQSTGGGSRTMLGIFGGYMPDTFVFDAELAYGMTSWNYFNCGLSVYREKDSVVKEIGTSKHYAVDLYMGLGLNLRCHLGLFHPNFFVQSAIGFSAIQDDGKYYSSSKSKDNYDSKFLFNVSAGVDVPFSESCALSFEYTYHYVHNRSQNHAGKVGLLLTLPK